MLTPNNLNDVGHLGVKENINFLQVTVVTLNTISSSNSTLLRNDFSLFSTCFCHKITWPWLFMRWEQNTATHLLWCPKWKGYVLKCYSSEVKPRSTKCITFVNIALHKGYCFFHGLQTKIHFLVWQIPWDLSVVFQHRCGWAPLILWIWQGMMPQGMFCKSLSKRKSRTWCYWQE